MQKWVKVENNRMWIPTIMTLPIGMLYPQGNPMKWAFCEMMDIPEEERENFPIPGQEGKFYTKRYDTDNPTNFDVFLDGMAHINELFKDRYQREREEPLAEDHPEDEETE